MSKIRVTFRDLQDETSLMNERLASVGSGMRVVANAGDNTRYLTTENLNPNAYVKTTVLCTGTAKECVEQGWKWVMMHTYDFVTAENRRLLSRITNAESLNTNLRMDYLEALRVVEEVKTLAKTLQEELDSLRESIAWDNKYLTDPDADSVDY